MLQKLKLKLVVINVVLLIVVLVAVFVLVYFLLESQLKDTERTLLNKVAFDETIFDYTYYIYDIEEDRENYEYPSAESDDIFSSSLRMFYVILDSDRDIIKYLHNSFISKTSELFYLLNKVDATDKKYGEVNFTEHRKLSFVIESNEYDEKLYVFVDRTNREETMSAYIYTAFIALFGSVICVLFISVYVAGRAIKPIKESMDRQDKFVADASHELRTPIAVIRSNTELIMDSPEQTVGENMKWLEYIYKEAKRMTKMTEDLLLLSRADAKTKSEKNEVLEENINLSVLVSEVYDSFRPLFAGKNLSADGADITQEIYAPANELSIRQLLTILIDNAVKYTKEGGISVKLEKDEHSAYIKVIDTGIGMPKEMKDKIFERFFRIDKARSKATGGFGLGLSIAKTIADEHRGEITVESEPGKGSEFCVRLPLKLTEIN